MRKRSSATPSATLLQVAMKSKGFTLIELMVTVSILAILLGLAAPSFVDALRRTQARNLGDDFLSTLTYARQQAISTNQCVSVCMVANASAQAPICSTKGIDWNRGWIVFANPACDNNPIGINADLLQVNNGVGTSGPTMGPTSKTNNPRLISFRPTGQIGLSDARQFNIAPFNGNPISAICVSRTGRARRITSDVIGNDDCDG
jgi:type IV fimbrial biogenesis protein FimT